MAVKPVHLEVEYSIAFESVYQTGDGSGSGGVIDRAMRLRRIAGRETLFVPGSALKGALRHGTELLWASLDRIPSPQYHSRGSLSHGQELVRYLFGYEAEEGALRFSDAIHSVSERELLELRTGVQIDRKRGAALEDHLFVFECALPTDSFVGSIEGYLAPDREKETMSCLLIALSKLKALGSRRSVGWGSIRQVNITNVKLNGQVYCGDWREEARSLWKK